MIPQFVTIRETFEETLDVLTFSVEASTEGTAALFAPGQFSMLYMFGVGEVPISISGDPTELDSLTYTVRSVGPVSKALCSLKPGDSLGMRGPYGTGWPLQEAYDHDLVIVAGGLGLAPLRSVIYSALHDRRAFGRVILLYGGRSPSDLLFSEELREWIEVSPLEVYVTVDFAPKGYHGIVGVVPRLIRRAELNPKKTIALVCGPEIMMRYTIAELERVGFEHKQIYLSLERNMKCALGICGRCQFGPDFICKDGPVLCYEKIQSLFQIREL